MIVEGREIERNSEIRADAVIVGSGCSGAVLARELAEAGFEVVVLEEGGHYTLADYGKFRPSEAARFLYRNYATVPTLSLGDTPVIYILAGRCVGGSSLVNGGVCFRTPEYVIEDWRTRGGLTEITHEEMDRAFSRVEETLEVAPVPESMQSEGVRRLATTAARIGWSGAPIKRNVVDCDGCCRCLFGCPHDAKRPVTMNYLAKAQAAGARIYSDCRADRILVRRGRAAGVEASVLDRTTGRRRRRLAIRAPVVVLAGGSLHTPLLLARAGVGRRSGAVGRNLTLHPGGRVYGLFDEKIEGWRGSFQSYAIDQFGREGIKMISIYPPIGVIASGLPGFGRENRDAMENIDRIAAFGVMISDVSTGSVRRTPWGEPLVAYRLLPQDKAKLVRGLRLLAELYFEAGARKVYLPFDEIPVLSSRDELEKIRPEAVDARRMESSSQHPLGTCRMGKDPRSSVVGPAGEAHDLPGLYVVDGSIVPTSVNVNPQITIMGLATRIAWKMAERGRTAVVGAAT
ncbi:MAG: GMC family oxidoreductase [Planctomycetes bacterium]|nr:GMC family oxidoreductase [Planctomycetota bacterium]